MKFTGKHLQYLQFNNNEITTVIQTIWQRLKSTAGIPIGDTQPK